MNSSRKPWSLVIGLVALLVSITLVSCSGKAGSATSAGAETGQDTLAKILKTKKVKIGVMSAMPPYDYLDDNKQPTGYNYRVAKEIGAALGAEVELVQLVSQNRIPALQTGDIDIGVYLMGCYPERAKLVQYSTHPYMVQTIVMLGKKSLRARTWSDLHGVKMGLVKGGGGLVVIEERAPKDATRTYFDDDTLQMNALVVGQVDIIHADGIAAQQLIKKHPEANLEVKWVLGVETEHLMVRLGDYALRDWLDVFLLSNYTNGHLAQWWDSYIKDQPLGDLPTMATALVPDGGSVNR
jgi:polar amino acid transport system substrate-binding protein